jgi:hypothetical protein
MRWWGRVLPQAMGSTTSPCVCGTPPNRQCIGERGLAVNQPLEKEYVCIYIHIYALSHKEGRVGIYYYLLGGLDRCWGKQSPQGGVDLTTIGQPIVKIIYVVGGGVYIYIVNYIYTYT